MMIALIVTLVGLFTWLLKETDWLRIRLPQYAPSHPCSTLLYAQWLSEFNMYHQSYYGGVNDFVALPEYQNKREFIGFVISHNGKRDYNRYVIHLSPGITDILPGMGWLDSHWNDLRDYEPTVYIKIDGLQSLMHLRNTAVLKAVIKELTKGYSRRPAKFRPNKRRKGVVSR
jgi:hypothetical protein